MCDLLTDVGNYISFETTCDNPIRNPLLLVARLSPMHVDALDCVSPECPPVSAPQLSPSMYLHL